MVGLGGRNGMEEEVTGDEHVRELKSQGLASGVPQNDGRQEGWEPGASVFRRRHGRGRRSRSPWHYPQRNRVFFIAG